MAYEGLAILRGLQAAQGVVGIAGGIEELKEKKALRLEREQREAWLNKWVDPQTRPSYMALKDYPERQAFLDNMMAPHLNEQGLIQNRTIMRVGESAMWDKEIIDSFEMDVIAADRAKVRKLFEKAQDISGKTSKLNPEYIKIMKQYTDLQKAIDIETGMISKHKRAMELKKAGRREQQFAPQTGYGKFLFDRKLKDTPENKKEFINWLEKTTAAKTKATASGLKIGKTVEQIAQAAKKVGGFNKLPKDQLAVYLELKGINADIMEEAINLVENDFKFKQASRSGNIKEQEKIIQEKVDLLRRVRGFGEQTTEKAVKGDSREALEAKGYTFGKKTDKGEEVYDSEGKLIGYYK